MPLFYLQCFGNFFCLNAAPCGSQIKNFNMHQKFQIFIIINPGTKRKAEILWPLVNEVSFLFLVFTKRTFNDYLPCARRKEK